MNNSYLISKLFWNQCGQIVYGKESLAAKFIEHRGYGEGTPYVLNRDEIYASFPANQVELTEEDFSSIGALSEGQRKSFSKNVMSYSQSPGTLGNFTVRIEGEIFRDEVTNELVFEGVLIIYDIYDFNEADRPGNDESLVTFGRIILDGDDFEIFGTIEAKQIEGEKMDVDGVSTEQIVNFREVGFLLKEGQIDATTVGKLAK